MRTGFSTWRSALVGCLAIGAAFFSLSTVASADVIVGQTDGGNCYPFNCNDSGQSTEQSIDYTQIYSSSAFSSSLSINSVTFYNTLFSGSIISGDYTVSFGTTTDGLSSGYPLNISNSSPFFAGHLGSTNGNSFTITGTPFNYDPSVGNLVLEVVASNQANIPNGSGNGYFDADYTGVSTTRAFMVTGQGPASGTGALVTGFNVSAVPLPPSLPMFGAALLGLAALTLRRKTVEQPFG